jgi:putative heme-binding domain-containing protein
MFGGWKKRELLVSKVNQESKKGKRMSRMLSNRWAVKLGLLFSTLCLTGSLRAVESWADKKLTITNGLELWLDASRELTARASRPSKLMNGGSVDCWHDASGKGRTVYQPLPDARPHLQQSSPSTATMHFDGNNDFFSATGLASEFEEVTVFLLGAPRTNRNDFNAFLAMNREGENDFSSGLNIDLGNRSKEKFDLLNVEGTGFFGIQNLMLGSVPFGEPHVLTITARAGTNVASLWLDGRAQKTPGTAKPPKAAREKKRQKQNEGTALACDQLTVGARFYSNDSEPAHAQGYFDGDISEVLVFSRILSEAERSQVESYLKTKLPSKLSGRTLVPFVNMTNPPAVQMLLPGFAVKELPISLNNINCVKYREDGKLVALGYDGNVWILTDTDGDGVEDKATAFWNKPSLRSPIGMALTPPGYARGQGVFVPSKGKLSLIVDTNADDVADEEIIVANGWNESFHGVDALGTAVDKEGNVYFGLGTVNFVSAYLVDKDTGKSNYDLKNEHGTIMKVSPDFKKREIVCTGIRYPVALAFNEANDLFCTDQEGATWLPNGNPFDELLQIEPGKHYGFPPRHPKYLPGVIDEPSVFDYAPQHECTCGLNFNLPAGKGSKATFGPATWRGDAFVAGYSRGKLFRTKLVKTDAGYVAQSQLIACLNMMPVDACISPAGDLVVPVHSGKPDWGSGPTGTGKIYKITYDGKNTPQPVAVWPASPTETHLEFDRALEPAYARELVKGISMTQGKYVVAGDEFETIRPGYRVVQDQMLEPRYKVKVVSSALNSDGRSLIVHTEPRRDAVQYSISISGVDRTPSAKELPQRSFIGLSHNLTGVEVEWQNSSTKEKWSGWLPHLDLQVAQTFTEASATQAGLWATSRKPGRLKMRAQLDLWQMLRAATQPGSELDFSYPDETVTVVLKSKSMLTVNAPAMKVERNGETEVYLTVIPKESLWLPIEIAMATSSETPSLQISWFTAEDSRRRALPLRRIFLPWARPATSEEPTVVERRVPELAGGNWLRGKKIFFSEGAACSKCHSVGGSGGKIGPDLSNLIHRDFASVMKDVMEPSAAINPDHIAYNVELKDGEALTGILLGSTEQESRFADVSGKITTVPKTNIVSLKPSTISLMPEGLLQSMSEQQRKDLFAFLLTVPMEVAPLERTGEPPPRSRAEVETLLQNAIHPADEKSKHLQILLCSGPKDHGVGEHDYPFWQKRWSKLLSLAENVTIDTADSWPSSEQFRTADVILFYSNNPGWSSQRASELDSFLNRGGGALYLHYAVDGHEHCEDLAQRIGLAWKGGASKFRHGGLDLNFEAHPITAGVTRTHFEDESYWNLIGNQTNLQLIATAAEEGVPQPLMWTREQGRGRVFVSIPGHYTWTFDDPVFRLLVFRGMAWSSRQPLGRFDGLVTLGARMGD